MRSTLAIALVSLLGACSAVGPLTSTAAHAAVPAMASRQPSITGTLVATPQSTLPATLLLQVGGQTLPVLLTTYTRVQDRNEQPLALAALHDGDTLQVVGEPNASGGITASLVEDTSTPVITPPATTEVTGILAATPNPVTSPPSGILCLSKAQVKFTAIQSNVAVVSPCPTGQLPVYLTSVTRIVRRYGEGSGLDELSVGDALQVSASFANAQFTALVVKDLSIQVDYTTFSGAVQNVAANGGTTNVTALVTKVEAGYPPFSVGTTLVLPLANSDSPACTATSAIQLPCTRVTTGTGTTNGYVAGTIQPSATVTARGIYNTQLGRFIAITAITIYNPAPPATQTVQGVLASAPNTSAMPVVLCLKDTRFQTSGIQSNVAVVSPCPNGQLPVYVTSATRIVRRYGEPSALDELRPGDTLRATGSFVNAQFTASLVKDLLISKLVGTVGYISFNTNPTYFTLQVPGYTRPFTIYVQSNTQITVNGTTTNQVTTLNPGQTVTVLGIYNRNARSINPTFRVYAR